MLVAGCRSGTPSAADTQLHPPIAVMSCAVADSASSLAFRDATGKLYTLFYDANPLEGDALSLAVGSEGGVGSPLTPNSPVAQQLRHALHAFVALKATPAQIQDLKRRATLEEELDTITEDEWTLLETVSFTYRLKRKSANKILEDTGTSAPDPQD
jgi:hypothetical protein